MIGSWVGSDGSSSTTPAALLDRSHHGLLEHERDHAHAEPHRSTARRAGSLWASSSDAGRSRGGPSRRPAAGRRPSMVVPRTWFRRHLSRAVERAQPVGDALRCRSPEPTPFVVESNPRPSSTTAKVSSSARSESDTVTEDAEAYFATFWSASRHREVHSRLDVLGVPSDARPPGPPPAVRTCAPAPRWPRPSPLSASSGG